MRLVRGPCPPACRMRWDALACHSDFANSLARPHTHMHAQASEALPGYEDVQPMVYCGLFPTDTDDYQVR